MRCAQLFNTKHAGFTGRQFLKLLFSMLCYHPQLGYLHKYQIHPSRIWNKGKTQAVQKIEYIFFAIYTS